MNFNFEPNSNNKDPLKEYGRNVTDLALKNKLDPVIGRDDEIRRIIRILSRKTKNNPVLVGEPGVGKTAIIEGLAKKIVLGEVPEDLKNKEIIEIDIAQMFAGTSYQGEFEKRIKNLMKKIQDSNGNKIIFIDEIHMIVGTGKNASGSMDMANILKPMMARGEIKLIGATTNEEYKNFIESDGALERRIQKINVEEPNVDDAISIMRGIKEKFEVFHGVKIEDSAIVSAVNMSNRFINDRFLPDKAIDLIDEAAATLKTIINTKPEELEKLEQNKLILEIEKVALSNEIDKENKNKIEKRIIDIDSKLNKINDNIKVLSDKWNNEKKIIDDINIKKKEIDNLRSNLLKAQNNFEYEKASEILYKKIPEQERALENLESKIKQDENSLIKDSVGENEIAEIISKWTKIPVNKLLKTEKDKILNLEEGLNKKVIGQPIATELIAKTIIRSKADVNDPDKPIGSFMFLGSTGVGKTELARSLASELFDSSKQMIKIDMSEFMETNSVNKLIGAPPGYVGYGERTQLTDKVRNNPYSVILFDEIEKANRSVLDILLQILEDGQIKDSKGRDINFKNTIIIMTSNVAANEILSGKYNKKDISNELKKHFRPEFINRIDEIIPFNTLDDHSLKSIIDLELNKLSKRIVNNKNINIKFNKSINELVFVKIENKEFGARPIKRIIKSDIETLIAENILSGQIAKDKYYEMTIDDKIIIKEIKLN